MSTFFPDTAFILAAGLGTRLRPITDTIPKPLVKVAGKPIIGHILDRLFEVGIQRVIVNTHYHADKMNEYLSSAKRFDLTIIHEAEILETGGSLKNGLKHIGTKPFFAINGDAFWHDAPECNILRDMAAAWHPQHMDILLMLFPLTRMITPGSGDYVMAGDHKLTRAHDKNGDLMFASVRICNPAIFKDSPDGKFSFLTLMDEAEQQKRLFGAVHTGSWYHISTPEDLAVIENTLTGSNG